MSTAAQFGGSKLVLLCESSILVYRRDVRPDIPFPDCWDLPGGGREGDETPQQCALREMREEFGLFYSPERLSWSRAYPGWRGDGRESWFFGGALTPDDIEAIRFGNEGQYWRMMAVGAYFAAPDTIPHHPACVRDFLAHG
jgi:8-oxo-dGTP diphosphatase